MEWLELQFSEVMTVITKGGAVALGLFLLFKIFKGGGAIAAVLSAVIVASIIWWAINGGYEDISEMFSNWTSKNDVE